MLRILLLLLAIAQAAPVQPPGPAGTCEIHGRVTDKDTGQPIARALVHLHNAGSRERFVARTDDAGRFRFTGLGPGQYSGIVIADPFRPTHDTGSLSGAPGRPLVLKEGEVREFDVALPRTFAVDVRVVDEWGDPLSGIRLSGRSPQGGGGSMMMWNHTTDDRGRQRVFGLQAGNYIFCAESGSTGRSSDVRREALLRTCHPSALDEEEARPVRVDRSDLGEIEIRMRTGRTFTVAGRILDAAGAPAAGTSVTLAKHFSGGSTGSGMQPADGDGQFRIPGVPPGEYVIEVSIGGPDRPEQRRPLERALVPIRVKEDDIDLVVRLQRTVDVSGRVVLEDPAAPFVPTPNYGPMSVWSRVVEGGEIITGSLESNVVDKDKQFTLRRIFGRRTIEVVNVPRGWYVKSIRYAGNEVIDEAVAFKDSTEPAIEVFLSNRGAAITGRVTDDRGDPVAGAQILMFAADPARMSWKFPESARATRTGEFRLGPVRGGDYFVVAIPGDVRPIQEGESRRLERLAAVAERVTLGDLDERSVDLRVVIER